MDKNRTIHDMRSKKIIYCVSSLLCVIFIWRLFCVDSGIYTIQHSLVKVYQDNLQFNKMYENSLRINNQQLNAIQDILNGMEKPAIVYCITPTYWRYVQKAELTRILQTLTLASNIVSVRWIIIEDSEKKSVLVKNLLNNVSPLNDHLKVTHLNAKTTSFQKLKQKDPRWKRHRGVEQRNMALKWLRDSVKSFNSKKSIVYFMDDDNTYDVKLFREIAKVNKVGVWPVGLVGGLNAETPILDRKTGKVTGYNSGWEPNRPFAIDMAGFGINLDLIIGHPNATFSYKMEKGFQESEFLSYFIKKEELEPLADNCTKVYVWHTRAENPVIKGTIPGLEV